jgi:hypothetical protein
VSQAHTDDASEGSTYLQKSGIELASLQSAGGTSPGDTGPVASVRVSGEEKNPVLHAGLVDLKQSGHDPKQLLGRFLGSPTLLQ